MMSEMHTAPVLQVELNPIGHRYVQNGTRQVCNKSEAKAHQLKAGCWFLVDTLLVVQHESDSEHHAGAARS